jgi:excisionase family DNA binding protein
MRAKRRIGEERPPYRVREAAEKLGVSTKAILGALKTGRLPGFKLNRVWLIPRAGVDGLGGAQD